MLSAQQQRHPIHSLEPVVDAADIQALQERVTQVPVGDVVKDYIVRLAGLTRDHRLIALGVSPRGSLGLMRMAQAWSLVRGLSSPREDEVMDVASAVIAHRLILSPEARSQGMEPDDVVRELMLETEVKVL
jgi:MoxR-like ATPase